MDTREWIFVLGVIAVVIIALILAARWRRQRFDDIRPGDHLAGGAEDDDFISNELPGGGARTVGYRDHSDIERMNDEIRERAEASKPRLSSFRPEPVVQPSLLDDDPTDNEEFDDVGGLGSDAGEESVPLLLDPSDEHNLEQADQYGDENQKVEQHHQVTEAASSQQIDQSAQKSAAPSETNTEHLKELENLAGDLKEPEPELRVEKDDQPAHLRAENRKAQQVSQQTGKQPGKQQAKPQQQPEPQQQAEPQPGDIIIINLMTEPTQPYEGATLLKLVSELGLRHGEMEIFHYCGRHGDEQPQFRMANLLKPGYFDLDNMDRTRTHALCFFFELRPDQDNMKIYESMLSVINKLRDDLGGELHDENRSVFTIQTSEHCRHRIRDYQRRHLLLR